MFLVPASYSDRSVSFTRDQYTVNGVPLEVMVSEMCMSSEDIENSELCKYKCSI